MTTREQYRLRGIFVEDQQSEELRRWFKGNEEEATLLFFALTNGDDAQEVLKSLCPVCAELVCALATGTLLRMANESMARREA